MILFRFDDHVAHAALQRLKARPYGHRYKPRYIERCG
jgi:hypothetical protein